MLIARVLYSINLDQFNGVNAHFQTKINIFMSIDFEIAPIIKARKLLKITVIPMILFYITHLKMTECNWGNGTCFELIAHNNMVLMRNLTHPIITIIGIFKIWASSFISGWFYLRIIDIENLGSRYTEYKISNFILYFYVEHYLLSFSISLTIMWIFNGYEIKYTKQIVDHHERQYLNNILSPIWIAKITYLWNQ